MSQSGATQREVLRLAEGLWKALEGMRVPTQIREALNRRLYDSTVRWALALVLSCWRHYLLTAHASEARQIMREAGGANLLDFSLPASVIDLLAASDAANTAAQVTLITGVAERVVQPPDARPMIVDWLRGDGFMGAGRNLIQRFPEPGSARPALWGSPPADALVSSSKPASSAQPASKPSRSKNFDTADYSSRRRKS